MQRVAAMVEFRLGSTRQPLRRILCLGSHCDDIEIGCGGTILRWLDEFPNLQFYWVVFSSTPKRRQEAFLSAQAFLRKARTKKVVMRNYRDSFLPSFSGQIKEDFEKLKKFKPDLVLTHYRHDLHQDHRLICELTWNTFRDHLILEYEIPKYDGDLGQPNLFVPLGQESYKRKVRYIMDAFETQRAKRWFEKEIFLALMRLRGMECIAPTGYAEAFYCRKLVV